MDTVAPNAPTINAISPDNGFSATDEITNVQNPTFSGTAEPGSTVTLINAGNNGSGRSSGTPVGTTIADGQGNWSYTVPGGGLSRGTYLYTATATDVAGNVSTQSSTFTVVIDRTAPVQPVVTSISPDTGLVTTDGATDQPRLIFNGTAEPGDWVYVSLDGQPLGMTVADSTTGAWSYNNTANAIPDGTHSVTVTTMDRAGNLSQVSKAYTITVDTVATAAPVVTGLSPDTGRSATDWVTDVNTLTFNGMTIPGGLVQVYVNGISIGTTTASGDNGQWCHADTSNSTTAPTRSPRRWPTTWATSARRRSPTTWWSTRRPRPGRSSPASRRASRPRPACLPTTRTPRSPARPSPTARWPFTPAQRSRSRWAPRWPTPTATGASPSPGRGLADRGAP